MTSRFDLPPEGRRHLFALLCRLDPESGMGFPYEAVIAEPARWPAGNRWRARRRMAAPLRVIGRWIDRALILPLSRLATLIEGQPLVWWCPMEGWEERRGWRAQQPRTQWWIYSGPITPAIRQMFVEHPERFADCTPDMLYRLRTGA